MVDKLVDFIISVLHLFKFWHVVDESSEAYQLRLGKKYKKLEPGIHFVFGLGIDKVWDHNVVVDTMKTAPQSLTTKDDKSIVVSFIITFVVEDIEKLLFNCEGAESVLLDSSYGAISDYFTKRDWEVINKGRIELTLKEHINNRAQDFGIRIDNVQQKDLALCENIRLIGGLIPEKIVNNTYE